MHDPKLYRLLRDPDQNKREQALVTLVEGDYMESMERLCKGVTVLEPGMRTSQNEEVFAYTIELSTGCEAYWRVHEDIRDIAVRLALCKTGRLRQVSNHKLLGNVHGSLSPDEIRERQWIYCGFKSLIAVGDLPGLRHFGPFAEKVETYEFMSFQGMPDLVSLELPANLSSLEEVRIQDCDGLSSLDGLTVLASLKRIWICNLPSLIDINALSGLTNLEEIRVSNCQKLESIECLSGLTALKTVYFENCENLSIVPSSWPGQIQTLVLKKVAIESIGALPRSLKQVLSLRDSRRLKTLDGLEECADLSEVVVSHTIKDYSALEGLDKTWLNLKLDCLDDSFLGARIPEQTIDALLPLEGLMLKLTYAGSSHFDLLNPELIAKLTRLKGLDLSCCTFSDYSIFLPLIQLQILRVEPRSDLSKTLGGCTFKNGEIEAMRLKLLAM